MKKLATSIALLASVASGIAQSSSQDNSTYQCSTDSIKTNRLNISTGIGMNGISDSVIMNAGYGYNTYYTTPNDNKDTLWTVAKLSSKYNPRLVSLGFAYTGAYLLPGGHPSVITADVPGESYNVFQNGGVCSDKPSLRVSNWISVYADAGGQNSGINNAENDGYSYERCFYICNADTLKFDLRLLADDIIDTVQVDNINLYVTPNSSDAIGYKCDKMISILKDVSLSSGRHVLRVWTRDVASGHLALNVYGYISSAGMKKNIVRSKYDSRCDFKPLSVNRDLLQINDVLISPNPNKGKFTLTIPTVVGKCKLEIYGLNGQKLKEQDVFEKENDVEMNVASGIYFLRLSNETEVKIQKLIIE
jgi:hypothetical protein